MGLHITGVLVRTELDERACERFDFRPQPLKHGVCFLPTTAYYLDHWAEELGIRGSLSARPLGNVCGLHRMVRELVGRNRFAVIDTDYFGGCGDQSAAVYAGASEIMRPATGQRGPINAALKHLGVRRRVFVDGFTRVGLDRFRSGDDYYLDYEE